MSGQVPPVCPGTVCKVCLSGRTSLSDYPPPPLLSQTSIASGSKKPVAVKLRDQLILLTQKSGPVIPILSVLKAPQVPRIESKDFTMAPAPGNFSVLCSYLAF